MTMTKFFSVNRPISLLGLSFALLLIALPAQAQQSAFEDLSLNGLAAYKQLRKEYYIGGLYLQSLSQDTDAAISISGKKRMQIRVVIDRWSPRSFAQQWNQLILINNDQESLNEFADQILAFIDMPKDDLVAGDIITIDMDPNRGTTVYLDAVKVFSHDNNDFFDVLLNTWIGQRPPSSDFKNDILTLPTDQNGTQLLVRYESIAADKNRQKQIAGWFKNEQVAEKSTSSSKPPVAVAPPNTDTAVASNRKTSSKSAATTTAAVTSAAAAPEVVFDKPQVASSGNNTKVTAAKPEAKAKAAPKPEPKLESKAPLEPAAKTVVKAPASKPAPEVAAKPAPAQPVAVKESAEDIEQAKLLRRYRASILKLTYLNTQYPKRAMDFKQEGLVVLNIKVNREGKVIDVSEETSTQHKLLNNAARKAVKKTAPYPEVPKTLKGKDFEFTLPFNFKL